MEVILGLIATFSSTAAALFGLGGGLILIGFLPEFLPPDQIIPVHGVTQLASNASRSLIVYHSVEWRLLPKFLIGSLLGSVAFTIVLVNLSITYIPVIIGVYILLKLWSKRTDKFLSSFDSYYLLGFLQTGLGIVVGSTGQLTLPRVMKEFKERDRIVATSGMFMTLSHGFKLLVYGLIGFNYREYIYLLMFMISGACIGSYFGTLLRGELNDQRFNIVLKLLLTLLAARMIIGSIF